MILTMKKLLYPLKIRFIMLWAKWICKQNKIYNSQFKCTAKTKRCFINKQSPYYAYEFFGHNTPVCCATNLYTILKDVAKVLEANNLEYFISFGTLLGAVRHKGLIPWDTDIDILIAQKDKQKILSILQNKLPKSYNIVEATENNIVGSLIRVDFSKINTLHIDLFTYLEDKDKIVFGYDRHFLKTDIFPLQKIPFYNSEFFAPNNIQKQLITFYGKDYMKYAYKQWAVDKRRFEITDRSPAIIED